MIKAKENKKVVMSFKTLREACENMVSTGKAASMNAASYNIRSAIRGHEGRTVVSGKHTKLPGPRMTAYGYTWSETKR